MNRVDEIRQSLQEIVDRLSKHLDHFEQGESTWRLEQMELKFCRMREKGGKEKELPVHHKLEELCSLDISRRLSRVKS